MIGCISPFPQNQHPFHSRSAECWPTPLWGHSPLCPTSSASLRLFAKFALSCEWFDGCQFIIMIKNLLFGQLSGLLFVLLLKDLFNAQIVRMLAHHPNPNIPVFAIKPSQNFWSLSPMEHFAYCTRRLPFLTTSILRWPLVSSCSASHKRHLRNCSSHILMNKICFCSSPSCFNTSWSTKPWWINAIWHCNPQLANLVENFLQNTHYLTVSALVANCARIAVFCNFFFVQLIVKERGTIGR